MFQVAKPVNVLERKENMDCCASATYKHFSPVKLPNLSGRWELEADGRSTVARRTSRGCFNSSISSHSKRTGGHVTRFGRDCENDLTKCRFCSVVRPALLFPHRSNNAPLYSWSTDGSTLTYSTRRLEIMGYTTVLSFAYCRVEDFTDCQNCQKLCATFVLSPRSSRTIHPSDSAAFRG